MDDHAELSALASNAVQGGDGEYEALVRALWPNAFRIAWSILGERGAAEDAAQSACASICAELPNLANVAAFPAWAYRIIVSRARDRARSLRRLQRRETVGYETARDIPIRDDPSARIDLEMAIGKLPESLRLPVEPHYFVGLTSGEVGRALGIPAPTVRFRLMIARQRLRPLLSDVLTPAAALETR